MSKTDVTCAHCGTPFQRATKEVNRSNRLGRPHYCSRSCMGSKLLDNIPVSERTAHTEGLVPDNRKDEFSPFRWHLRNAARRTKECTITLDDLKKQWEKQEGRCPYTGWELKNLPCTNHKKQLDCTPDRASLDRKDSSKGYTPDNVHFVSTMANYAKNRWADGELLRFCQSVVITQGISMDAKCK